MIIVSVLLISATCYVSARCLEIMLDKSPDMIHRRMGTSDGDTLLHIAAFFNSVETLIFLLGKVFSVLLLLLNAISLSVNVISVVGVATSSSIISLLSIS